MRGAVALSVLAMVLGSCSNRSQAPARRFVGVSLEVIPDTTWRFCAWTTDGQGLCARREAPELAVLTEVPEMRSVTVSGAQACSLGGDGGVTCAHFIHDTVYHPAIADVDSLSADLTFFCARTLRRELHCWGRSLASGPDGELASIHPTTDMPPALLARDVDAASVGDFHLCVLGEGRVSCLGRNTYGQLTDRPASEGGFRDVGLANVTAIAAGFHASCALVGGDLWCWGRLDHSDVCDPSLFDDVRPSCRSPVPRRVVAHGAEPYVRLAGDSELFCMATASGRLDCWVPGEPSAYTHAAGVRSFDVSRGAVCFIDDGAEIHCSGPPIGELGPPARTALPRITRADGAGLWPRGR